LTCFRLIFGSIIWQAHQHACLIRYAASQFSTIVRKKGDVTRIIQPHPEIDVATLFEAEYRDRKQMNNDKLCQSINI
jgi:hypothetical protein